MTYNLTENQKHLAEWIVAGIRKGNLNETFKIRQAGVGELDIKGAGVVKGQQGPLDFAQITEKTFEALAADGLVLTQVQEASYFDYAGSRRFADYAWLVVTARGQLYRAVDSHFAEDAPSVPTLSTLAHPHPPEIAHSIDRLRKRHPDATKLGFLVMRFTAAKPFERIVNIIKETAALHGIEIIRADEMEFHADLWGNV